MARAFRNRQPSPQITAATHTPHPVTHMLRAIAGGIIRLAMLVVALVLIVDVLYFVHGSLELFPTEEQQGTVRQVTGVAGAVLAFVQVGLWLLLRRLGSTSASPAPPVVGSPDDAGGQG